MAVRAALGAGRGELVAQLLGEAAVLGALAGAFGLVLAAWWMRLLRAAIGVDLPAWMRVDLDGRAFLWLPGPRYGLPAGINDLGTLGGTSSVALAIDPFGRVVGAADIADPQSFVGHAFLWQDGVMTDLGTLAPDVGSAAEAINRRGESVGGVGSGFTCRPVIWLPEARYGFPAGINALPLTGSFDEGNAFDINDRGEVVGWLTAGCDTPGILDHPYLWLPAPAYGLPAGPHDLMPGAPSGVFALVKRDFAPVDERLRSINQRLAQAPRIFADARTNLKNPPKIYTEIAISQAQQWSGVQPLRLQFEMAMGHHLRAAELSREVIASLIALARPQNGPTAELHLERARADLEAFDQHIISALAYYDVCLSRGPCWDARQRRARVGAMMSAAEGQQTVLAEMEMRQRIALPSPSGRRWPAGPDEGVGRP